MDAVERLIESRLVEREVERFSSEPVPRKPVDPAVAEVRSSFTTTEEFPAMLAGTSFLETWEGGPRRSSRKVTDAVRRILEERRFERPRGQWIAELKSRALIRRYVS